MVTDDYLRRSVAALGPFTPEVLEVMAMTPVPLVTEERVVLVAVRDVRRLPDGRVGASVVTDTLFDPSTEDEAPSFFAFVRIGDRWIIDDIVLLGSTDIE